MSQNLGNIIPVRKSVYINGTKASATGVLTWDNAVNVANNETVTIGTTVYTFKTTLTGAANEVLIGAAGDDSLTNLVNLINSGRAAVAASGVLTSDTTNPSNNDTVVIGAKTYTFKTNLTEVKASGVLTSDNTNPADGDTVTIGSVIYTFRTSLTAYTYGNTPYQIAIGVDADTTLGNLVAAINGDAGEGTKYSYNTPAHTLVTAGAVAAHATTVTAISVGTAGNSIAKAEASTHLDWDGAGATLTGGLAAVANEIKIGADTNATLTNLANAVNGATGEGSLYSTGTVASTEMTSSAVAANAITLTAIATGTAGNSLTKTESSTHLDWDGAGAVMTGGVTATPVNADVTATAVSSHATTVTAVTPGFAGNIASTETSAHLSWGAATLTGGGGTVGTYTIAKGGGMARRFIITSPQFTGSPTIALALYSEDDVLIKTLQATAAENALVDTAYEVMLSEGDYVKMTTTTAVEDTTLPVILEIR